MSRIRTSRLRWRCDGDSAAFYFRIMPRHTRPKDGVLADAFVPGIHDFLSIENQDVDQYKPCHDEFGAGVVSVSIRAAREDDTILIFNLVHELAVYEKLADAVDATPEMIGAALFGAEPRLFCDIAEWNGEAAGLAIWFLNFSTFRGRHGIYLEDLFVRPAFRGRGLGKALMARLASRCLKQGWARLEWSVLDWNVSSIAFYKSIGADVLDEWKICRLSGPALQAYAAKETHPGISDHED